MDLDQHHICKTIIQSKFYIYGFLNYLSVLDTYDLFVKKYTHIYVELPYSSAIDRHYILA